REDRVDLGLVERARVLPLVAAAVVGDQPRRHHPILDRQRRGGRPGGCARVIFEHIGSDAALTVTLDEALVIDRRDVLPVGSRERLAVAVAVAVAIAIAGLFAAVVGRRIVGLAADRGRGGDRQRQRAEQGGPVHSSLGRHLSQAEPLSSSASSASVQLLAPWLWRWKVTVAPGSAAIGLAKVIDRASEAPGIATSISQIG